jgi:hypothetical protein
MEPASVSVNAASITSPRARTAARRASQLRRPMCCARAFCGLIGFQEVRDFEKRWAK